MTSDFVRPAILLLVLSLLAGCSGDPAAGESISGKVTFDGEPVEKGRITFTMADGTGQPTSVAITDGSYSAKVPVGKHRVSITAQKSLGEVEAYPGDPNSPMHEAFEQYIPEQFNTKSTLEYAVTAGGATDVDFELQGEAGS